MRQTFLSKTCWTFWNITKKCLEKEKWRVLVVDKRTGHDKPYFNYYVFMFFMTISTSKKMSSLRARAEKGIARHIDVSSFMDSCRQRPSSFWLVRSEHVHASYSGLSLYGAGRKESSGTGLIMIMINIPKSVTLRLQISVTRKYVIQLWINTVYSRTKPKFIYFSGNQQLISRSAYKLRT